MNSMTDDLSPEMKALALKTIGLLKASFVAVVDACSAAGHSRASVVWQRPSGGPACT